MKSFEQLAKSAYEAHCLKFIEQDIGRGTSLPAWGRLETKWQACWIAAVKQVAAEVQAIH